MQRAYVMGRNHRCEVSPAKPREPLTIKVPATVTVFLGVGLTIYFVQTDVHGQLEIPKPADQHAKRWDGRRDVSHIYARAEFGYQHHY